MPAKGRWIGLKCHVLGLDLQADLEMHLASNGYVGLAKVEQDKINVCGLFRLDSSLSGKGIQTLERYLRAGGLDLLAARIFAARVDAESFLGVAGFRLGRQRHADGIAPLGDAWAMIPPFTGNGMSMAFESAELAAEPLQEWQMGREMWSETLDADFQETERSICETNVLGKGHASVLDDECRTGVVHAGVTLGYPAIPILLSRVAVSRCICRLWQALSPRHATRKRECWQIAKSGPFLATLTRRSAKILETVLLGSSGIETRHFAIPTGRLFSADAEVSQQGF